jgi:small conductance mechanosensitive channel
MENFDLAHYWQIVVDMTVQYVPKFLLALVFLLIGLRIIAAITKTVRKNMEKRNTDETLRPFLVSLLSWTLKAMLIISVIQMVGVETTSFIAVLGAAGLAIGLAFQGALGNFAGGVLILVFKPYKVGDLIEAQGQLGVVKEIQIFTTVLLNPQNRRIILPNGAVANGDITNFTVEGKLRVDLTVGISYDSDIPKAKKILLDVLTGDERVLPDPAPFVGVSELADSSVNLAVRPWCTPGDYWDVFFDITEHCKLALDKNGVTIPFPQMDVHLDKLQ